MYFVQTDRPRVLTNRVRGNKIVTDMSLPWSNKKGGASTPTTGTPTTGTLLTTVTPTTGTPTTGTPMTGKPTTGTPKPAQQPVASGRTGGGADLNWSDYVGASTGASTGAAAGAAMVCPPPPPPPVAPAATWYMINDPLTRNNYYVNNVTRETTWAAPPAHLVGPPPQPMRTMADVAFVHGTEVAAAAAAVAKVKSELAAAEETAKTATAIHRKLPNTMKDVEESLDAYDEADTAAQRIPKLRVDLASAEARAAALSTTSADMAAAKAQEALRLSTKAIEDAKSSIARVSSEAAATTAMIAAVKSGAMKPAPKKPFVPAADVMLMAARSEAAANALYSYFDQKTGKHMIRNTETGETMEDVAAPPAAVAAAAPTTDVVMMASAAVAPATVAPATVASAAMASAAVASAAMASAAVMAAPTTDVVMMAPATVAPATVAPATVASAAVASAAVASAAVASAAVMAAPTNDVVMNEVSTVAAPKRSRLPVDEDQNKRARSEAAAGPAIGGGVDPAPGLSESHQLEMLMAEDTLHVQSIGQLEIVKRENTVSHARV